MYILKSGKRKGSPCSSKTNDVFCNRHKKFLTDDIRAIIKSINLTKDQLVLHNRPNIKSRRENEIRFCEEYIKELENDLKNILCGASTSNEETSDDTIIGDEEPRPIIEYKAGPSEPIIGYSIDYDDKYMEYLQMLQTTGNNISYNEYFNKD